MGMLLLRKISSKVDGSDASGIITDTPAGTFSGTDTFTYAISDGRGGTATGTVTVPVAPGVSIP
jgi:hypothetical protein